jgi:hypothetical protein
MSFTGDFSLVANFSTENDALLSKIDLLYQKIPFTTVAEVNEAIAELISLRERFDRFLLNYNGKSFS